MGSMGSRGPGGGVSGTRRRMRHEGVVQEGERGEENKREGESCWKSGGGRGRPYTWRGPNRRNADSQQVLQLPLDTFGFHT